MESVVSEIQKTRKTLELLSLAINNSLEEVDTAADVLDHVLSEHINDRKMESIGLMAGGLAHDFKNFIHIIAVNANRVETITQDGEIQKRCRQILEVCYKASEMVDNMFTLAQIDQSRPNAVNLDSEVKKTADFLKKTLPEDIELEITLDGRGALIQGNGTQICQVVANLVNNAKDAVNGKGRIGITTRKLRLDRQDCRGHANARPGGFVTMAVTDTGSGIPSDMVSSIFDPFFTTKKDNNHTGFGLAMVYAIVKNHGGWIDVSSQVGQGTRFSLFFPTQTADSPGVGKHSNPRGRSQRGLPVEGEYWNRQGLQGQ